MARRKDLRAWSPEEDEALRAELANGASHSDIAARFGRSVGSIGIRASRIGASGAGASKRIWSDDEQRDAAVLGWPDFRDRYPGRTFAAYTSSRQRFRDRHAVPAVELTDYRRVVRKVEGDAVIAACVHVPQTDPAMWARVLAICERDRPAQLIIAGDIVTGDMFSHWDTKEPYEFDQELESLRLHLRSALEAVPRVVITPGNHVSNRIVRMTNGHIRLRHLIDMAGLSDAERERVDTTDIDYVELTSGGERFLVGHASNYSRIDAKVPAEYATIMESHVIVGNGHRMGFQMSKSGRWHGYEIGTLANPFFMGYAQDRLTNYNRMVQGFCTVRGGAVRLYGRDRPLTDWTAELAS